MTTIGLSMIVKDEAHIIERCLNSVLPLIDYAEISDTGSKDSTVEKMANYFARHKLPYRISNDNWVDFSTNRNKSLERLRSNVDIDYCITLDADEIFVYQDNFAPVEFKESLIHDVYDIKSVLPGLTYSRRQLFTNKKKIGFRGKVHEFVDAPPDLSCSIIETFFNRPLQDSARNQNTAKTRRDAEAIQSALEAETDDAMIALYYFYLGQCWRDCGELEKSIEAYTRRTELAGWNEEVCISFYNVGQLLEKLDRADQDIINAYLQAWDICPYRAEPLYRLARFYRQRKLYNRAYMYAKHALTITRPPRALFVEQWVYDYRLLDEYSLICYWVGNYQESISAGIRLINEGKLPELEKARARANCRLSVSQFAKTRPR